MMKGTRSIMGAAARLACLAAVACCAAARAQVAAPARTPARAAVSLSVKSGAAAPHTYLHFLEPRLVDFAAGLAEFNAAESALDGSVVVFFKPNGPGTYLLECEVGLKGPGDFYLTDLGKKLTPTRGLPPGLPFKPGREWFSVELPDAEPRAFTLHASARWSFLRCDITRFQ